MSKNLRYSAFVKIAGKTRSLDDDFDTEDAAREQALLKFWEHRKQIKIYSFTISEDRGQL